MKLEFLKVASGYICACVKEECFGQDIKGRSCLTRDGYLFSNYNNPDVDECLEFPYSLKEWEENHTEKYYCKCNRIPYRIIPNPYKKGETVCQKRKRDGL